MRTWSDAAVFQPVDMSVAAAKLSFKIFKFLNCCNISGGGGLDFRADLHAGQVFLKEKKAFHSRRTSISYKQPIIGKLLRATEMQVALNHIWHVHCPPLGEAPYIAPVLRLPSGLELLLLEFGRGTGTVEVATRLR